MNLPPQTYKDRLETLYKDIVMHVVYSYFELKVLPACNTSLDLCDFLQKHKHKLFHRFQPFFPCCECSDSEPFTQPTGSTNPRLEDNQFKLLYLNSKEINHDHEKKKGNSIKQFCLCQYEHDASNKIMDLDITLIHKLIKIFNNVCLPGNPAWIESIKNLRNKLSHLGEGERLDQSIYQEMKGQLEDAALNLAGTIGCCYQWDIDKRIKSLNSQNQQIEDIVTALSDMNNANMKKIIRRVGILILVTYIILIPMLAIAIALVKMSETQNDRKCLDHMYSIRSEDR